MKQKDLGLNPEQLMTLNIAKYENRSLNPERFETIKTRLMKVNGVQDITRAAEEPVNDSGFSDDISFGSTTLNVESRFVDPNYFEVLKGKVLEGRDFSTPLLATDSVQSVIINETAFHKLGLSAVNKQIKVKKGDQDVSFNVIGKVRDIQAYGFEQEVMPTIYFVTNFQWRWRQNIILRLNSQDIAKTVKDINKLWLEIEPGENPYYTFVDDTFAKMNKSYETSQRIVFSFGMLTLIISVFGLVGFAAYTAKARVREIAVRRILGASIASLLQLLNKDFVKLVIIANILADVLAYIYMKKWFANFAYHIEMPYLLFLGANLCIVTLTVFTVSLQSMRAVKANPVDALKYE
ncbi:ADOP: acidobacterial duplicated orphan permease [compost metagenome]